MEQVNTNLAKNKRKEKEHLVKLVLEEKENEKMGRPL